MTKTDNIQVLKRLEEFRINLEKGEIQPGCADWVVRMCQAYIAEEHFQNRMDWTAILRYEQKAREAFSGGNGTELLTKQYPNGCTLQEAINYFLERGEELETIGLI